MRQSWLYMVTVVCVLAGCKTGNNVPDVSGVKINLQTARFEKDFFRVDTLQVDASLQQLSKKHPGFTQDFVFNILGIAPDSVQKEIPRFISSYQSMNKDVNERIKNFPAIEAEVKKGLQFVHYYFPSYKLPEKLITFIGPINSYANIITQNALAVGLQLYMGKDYPLYLTPQLQEMYPVFISRRFEPDYIPVNCMKNIIDDMYPSDLVGKPLVEQMVEAGKRQYLLSRCMPGTPDTLTTGYTKKQLDDCYAGEKNIWSFFVQNDLLYNNDPNLTRDYMSDGPNTQVFGDASPGNIGQFVGMQIVTKWMEKKKDLTLDALMKTPPRKIFDEARYKPK